MGLQLSVGYGFAESLLVFQRRNKLDAPDHRKVRLHSHTVMLDFSMILPRRISVGMTLGVPVHVRARRIAPHKPAADSKWGLAASFKLSREWLGPNRANLFLATTVAIGVVVTEFAEGLPDLDASGVPTGSKHPGSMMVASDLSLNLVFGYNLRNIWSPYVAARGFGGPVFWSGLGGEDQAGDPRHFAVAAGSVFNLGPVMQLGVEGAFLGARSLNAVLGARF